jgi:hypothetical protein
MDEVHCEACLADKVVLPDGLLMCRFLWLGLMMMIVLLGFCCLRFHHCQWPLALAWVTLSRTLVSVRPQ